MSTATADLPEDLVVDFDVNDPSICAPGRDSFQERAAELADKAQHVPTPSQRTTQAKGVPSIAEAAALVAAGRNGRLLGRRIATRQATCAIAIGEET